MAAADYGVHVVEDTRRLRSASADWNDVFYAALRMRDDRFVSRAAIRIRLLASTAAPTHNSKRLSHHCPSTGYDEPEILPSSTHPICLMSADGGHS